MKLKIFLIIVLVTVCVYQVHTNLITKINKVQILIPSDRIDPKELRVALLSDLHIGDDESSFLAGMSARYFVDLSCHSGSSNWYLAKVVLISTNLEFSPSINFGSLWMD